MPIQVLAQIGGIFALLVLLHFVADWVFQSHAEAMAKPTNPRVRARHCFVYTAICCGTIYAVAQPPWQVIAWSAPILFLSHFAEDTYTPVYLWARYIRKPPEMSSAAGRKEFLEFASTVLGKILLITIDQIVHILFLLPTAAMLVLPESTKVIGLAGMVYTTVIWNISLIGSERLRRASTWKLWLDDQLDDPATPGRHVPAGFIGARSSLEAMKLVELHGLPTFMDLDHDLGGEDTTMEFLHWLAEKYPKGPVPKFVVHSANGEGRKSIDAYLGSWKKSLTL